jgi:hypothetical protein
VEEILIENGRAAGVRLRNGDVIRANKAVVSNASSWDTVKMVEKSIDKVKDKAAFETWKRTVSACCYWLVYLYTLSVHCDVLCTVLPFPRVVIPHSYCVVLFFLLSFFLSFFADISF